MAQPTPYVQTTSFEDDEVSNLPGRVEVDVAALDAELAAIELTLSETLANLAIIQRDDTELRDGVVDTHTLSDAVLAILATAGANVLGDWVTATAYAPNDLVAESDATYICAVSHTSGTFATDLAAGKWLMISPAPGSYPASGVTVTPAGGIAATDVQDALEELDTEKLSVSGNLSDVANAATALANLGGMPLAGGTFTGSVVFKDAGNLASGAALGVDAAGNIFNVTGSTTITSLAAKGVGSIVVLRFAAALTLTYSATDLWLPGQQNIVTEAGDIAIFWEYAAGDWRCIAYQRASGKALFGVTAACYVEAYLNANQSLSDATLTDIGAGAAEFTETADVGGNFAAATGVFTAPATGKYLFVWSATLLTNAGDHTESFYTLLTNDAGTALAYGTQWNNAALSNVNLTSTGAAIVSMAASNTAKLRAYHSTGAARSLVGNAYATRIQIVRLD